MSLSPDLYFFHLPYCSIYTFKHFKCLRLSQLKFDTTFSKILKQEKLFVTELGAEMFWFFHLGFVAGK